ncbi:unnamed protein product, partial [Adineta ricciae]
SEQHVKPYIDFEYYIDYNPDIRDSRIGAISCLKILHLLFDFNMKYNYTQSDNIDFVLDKFLALEASTSHKISYHFIHVNGQFIFENNQTFGLFFKGTIHFFLRIIAIHKCDSFNLDQSFEKCTISDLIDLLGESVPVLRTCCTKCYVYSKFITISELAYLLVLNKDNQYTLAIDLCVYSNNQQFRMFDCVKKHKQNPLVISSSFVSTQSVTHSYKEILKYSLLTYHESKDVSLLCQKNNQFAYEHSNHRDQTTHEICELINLNKLNDHMINFYANVSNCKKTSNHSRSNGSSCLISTIDMNIDSMDLSMKEIVSFIEKIITNDPSHLGYIRSCIHGNRNPNVIFFNIGGEYRFCPRLNRHHKRNTTAIFVDLISHKFTIRCKDPDCKNTNLIWHKIE